MEDGRLTVSTVETGTNWTASGFGFTVNQRNSAFEFGDGGFQAELELSIDGGQSWFVTDKLAYTRPVE